LPDRRPDSLESITVYVVDGDDMSGAREHDRPADPNRACTDHRDMAGTPTCRWIADFRHRGSAFQLDGASL
jgi:hypothetical protein